MNFEQAITPVALTMIGVGLCLRLLMDADILAVLGGGSWAGTASVCCERLPVGPRVQGGAEAQGRNGRRG